MLQWFKYGIWAFALIAIIVIVGFYYNQQNASVAAVQEIESTLKTNITGHLRVGEKPLLTKQELISSVIADTVDAQKTKQNNIKVDFVFLDKNGKATNQDSEIDSVQIRTALLSDKMEPQTQSVKRISLRQK